MKDSRILIAASALTLAAAGCSDMPNETPTARPVAAFSASSGAVAGSVYTMTNASSGNAVLVYHRGPDGALTAAGAVSTNGTGSGGGLGNQGGLVISEDGQWLLAVNAGSNTITAFRVQEDGSLERTSAVASGGSQPISVTQSGNVVYALNSGGAGSIVGFRLDNGGVLSMIPGSARPLSGAGVDPAEVAFDPQGRVLVVTEKATNSITTYTVGGDGLASGPHTRASHGTTPFGFAFSPTGTLIVSEAFGGAPDGSAASSYSVDASGGLQLISGSVPTTETAACWFVVTNNGRFAYTSNTGSGTISGYSLAGGALTLLDPDGQTAVIAPGSAPIDLALSRNSRFLYSLNSATHTISAFAVGADGSLSALGAIADLPGSANGLAAR